MNEGLLKELKGQKSINKDLSLAKAEAKAAKKDAEQWQYVVTKLQLSKSELEVCHHMSDGLHVIFDRG